MTPPATAEEMKAAILARYDGLSTRLKQIARFVLEEPNEVAVETLAVIAGRCGVQPSAIVRFAKTFGFEGASQMQRLFRDSLLSASGALPYAERVRRLGAGGEQARTPEAVLAELAEANALALGGLADRQGMEAFGEALTLLKRARIVHVAGFRRAFPVAAYLAYSLPQLGKPTLFVDGVGGLAPSQLASLGADDLLIAISYQTYAAETVAAVEQAVAAGARVLALSDSPVSPIAKPAHVALHVNEAVFRGFRSLSTSLCVAQALVIGLAMELAVE